MKRFMGTFNLETSDEYKTSSIIFGCVVVLLALLTGVGVLGGAVLSSVVRSVIQKPSNLLVLYLGLFLGVLVVNRYDTHKNVFARLKDTLYLALLCGICAALFCGAAYLYSLGITWVWEHLIVKAPIVFVALALLSMHLIAYYLSLLNMCDPGSLND